MSDIKIKDLPLAGTLHDTDVLVIEDDSTTRRIQISEFISSLISHLPVASSNQYGMVLLDTLLSTANQAADAKAVGDALKEQNNKINDLETGSSLKWNQFS